MCVSQTRAVNNMLTSFLQPVEPCATGTVPFRRPGPSSPTGKLAARAVSGPFIVARRTATETVVTAVAGRESGPKPSR